MLVSGIHWQEVSKSGFPTEAFGDDGIGERFKLKVKVKILTKAQPDLQNKRPDHLPVNLDSKQKSRHKPAFYIYKLL